MQCLAYVSNFYLLQKWMSFCQLKVTEDTSHLSISYQVVVSKLQQVSLPNWSTFDLLYADITPENTGSDQRGTIQFKQTVNHMDKFHIPLHLFLVETKFEMQNFK
jgi:hypothetical protein